MDVGQDRWGRRRCQQRTDRYGTELGTEDWRVKDRSGDVVEVGGR